MAEFYELGGGGEYDEYDRADMSPDNAGGDQGNYDSSWSEEGAADSYQDGLSEQSGAFTAPDGLFEEDYEGAASTASAAESIVPPEMPQSDVNASFADIVGGEEALDQTGQRTVERPDGSTETTFYRNDGEPVVTEYCGTAKTDEQKAAEDAAYDQQLMKQFGRSGDEQTGLRDGFRTAQAEFERADAELEGLRAAGQGGSDEALEALRARESAKTNYMNATNKLMFNEEPAPEMQSVPTGETVYNDKNEPVVTLYGDGPKNSEQQATDEAAHDQQLMQQFGRTEEQQAGLRQDLRTTRAELDRATAEFEGLRAAGQGGSDAALEALRVREAALHKATDAANKLVFDDTDPDWGRRDGEGSDAAKSDDGISPLTGTPDTPKAILAQFSKEELDQAAAAGHEAYIRDNDPETNRIFSTALDVARNGKVLSELGPLSIPKATIRASEGTAKSLVVNDEKIDLGNAATRALDDVLKEVDSHVKDGYSIDCARFAAGLCNRYVGRPSFEAPFREQDISTTVQNFTLSTYGPIESVDASTLPVMQPIYLDRGFAGDQKHDDLHHVIVKLPTVDGRDLFIEKVGTGGPVSIGTLADMAGFYGSTHIGVLNEFSLTSNPDDQGNVQVYVSYTR